MMPKIPIFSSHLFLLSLVFFCLVISPVNAVNMSCDHYREHDYETSAHYFPESCRPSDLCAYVDMSVSSGWAGACRGEELECGIACGFWIPCGEPEPTPTPTPTPSENCVSACGYTWTAGFTADDILLTMCMIGAGRTPVSSCDICGWQMAAMQEAFPCEVPPSLVPTYAPTPIPTVPPPPTIPTIVPGPMSPPQIITIGDKDIHDVDFAIPTIATIAMPEWNRTSERNNITSFVGNITDPYLNSIDAFSTGVTLSVQRFLYLPNWIMATIYTTVQPIATAFGETIVIVSEWGNVPLQLVRLALDNTPAGIQGLLIYGVCLEMLIYLLRGET